MSLIDKISKLCEHNYKLSCQNIYVSSSLSSGRDPDSYEYHREKYSVNCSVDEGISHVRAVLRATRQFFDAEWISKKDFFFVQGSDRIYLDGYFTKDVDGDYTLVRDKEDADVHCLIPLLVEISGKRMTGERLKESWYES